MGEADGEEVIVIFGGEEAHCKLEGGLPSNGQSCWAILGGVVQGTVEEEILIYEANSKKTSSRIANCEELYANEGAKAAMHMMEDQVGINTELKGHHEEFHTTLEVDKKQGIRGLHGCETSETEDYGRVH
ncbi:hypothetical protein L7F22_049111 [Adiantum nelumboides]|nr:hypothetical protein [Adiantum nelumboides]